MRHCCAQSVPQQALLSAASPRLSALRLPLPPQLVFGDMRDVIFERLYRFRVQSARLELVLQVRAALPAGS